MAKIDIPAVPSGFATTAALNERFQQIEDEFNNKVLYRSDTGAEPNTMSDELDMGTNKIINLEDGVQDKDAVNVGQIGDLISAAAADLDAGTGNVLGPLSAIDGDFAVYNGVTGRLIKSLSRSTVSLKIASWADIATTSVSSAGQIFHLAQHTSGGVGGGTLIAVAGSTTDDNGTEKNALGGFYLKRVHYDYITPQMFGALGNGSNNDTTAIQAAINHVTNTTFASTWVLGSPVYNRGGGTVFFPKGVYRTTSTLKVGQHVRLLGVSTSGFFYPYLTTSGSCIYADFSGNAWVIDTANYTSAGTSPGYKDSITGVQLDAGTYNSCHGVQIENIVIYTASSLYGGIRLNGAPNSSIINCGVYGTDINYFVASSWGVTLSDIKGIFYLYGCFAAPDCNSLKISGYLDGTGAKTISDANRPTQIFKDDFDVANGFPSALYNKRTGFLCYYNNGVIVDGLTTEHTDFGRIVVRTPGYTDTAAYVEACNEGYFAIATSSGMITSMFQFNPAITNGWVFGQVADMTLNECPASGVLISAFSTVKVLSSNPDSSGWKYYDNIKYIGSTEGFIRVSATGSSANIGFGTTYTTLNEALRRIARSDIKRWTVVIKDGDVVDLSSVVILDNKVIKFMREGAGANPTITINVASGYPFYLQLRGDTSLVYDHINIVYTAATSPADVTLAGWMFIDQNRVSNVYAGFEGCNITLQTGWFIFQQGFHSCSNINASFTECNIAGSSNAAILGTASGSAAQTNVISRQYGTTTAASIVAIGTNGWQNANVISSNFV